MIPDLTKYEYWNSDSNSWVAGSPAAATPVIPGPVGEMSAQFNNYLKQYLVLYCNGNNDVVMRTAPAPQGPWGGPEQMLVSSMQIPGGIYAPFLHPWSTGRELYYNLSLWSAYNVMLMHTVLLSEPYSNTESRRWDTHPPMEHSDPRVENSIPAEPLDGVDAEQAAEIVIEAATRNAMSASQLASLLVDAGRSVTDEDDLLTLLQGGLPRSPRKPSRGGLTAPESRSTSAA